MSKSTYCPRGCGAKWRTGDKTAQYLHGLTCKKQLWNGGRVGGK